MSEIMLQLKIKCAACGRTMDARGAGADGITCIEVVPCVNCAPAPPPRTLAQNTEAAIKAALEQNDNNRERAAAALGIGERTMYRRVREYGLNIRQPRRIRP